MVSESGLERGGSPPISRPVRRPRWIRRRFDSRDSATDRPSFWGRKSKRSRGPYLGLRNLSTKLSASPMATYLARSLSPCDNVGGRVHTPFGQSFVSFWLALISDLTADI